MAVLASFGASGQKIYKTDSRIKADVKVFVAARESGADLVVYVTDRSHTAQGNKGIWFYTTSEYAADKKIYIVDDESQAEVKIFYTDKDYLAGWRNKAKRSYFD